MTSPTSSPSSSMSSPSYASMATPPSDPVEAIKQCYLPVEQLKRENFQLIKHAMGDATVVMIGEATHGTEEFYQLRADITRMLIEECNFDFVALEADFTSAYRVNRFVRQQPGNTDSLMSSLEEFERFPKWMWRNYVFANFIQWLHSYNKMRVDKYGIRSTAGVYGLDLYGMYESIDHIIQYLEKEAPDLVDAARDRYAQLEMYRDDPHEYGMSVSLGLVESQQIAVTQELTEILRNVPRLLQQKGGFCEVDGAFCTVENAKVVKDAENYYRHALAGGSTTWNIRDTHMHDTLKSLLEHHTSERSKWATQLGWKPQARCVVWAHNSHLGDASATEWRRSRELNVGQLIRESFGLEHTFNIGFTSHDGSVSAATRWGGKRQTMTVNPSLPNSYERLFHDVVTAIEKENRDQSQSVRDFALLFRSNSRLVSTEPFVHATNVCNTNRLQRAIGVQYVKSTERQSHYFSVCLPRQFDFLMHIETSNALRAIDE